MWKNSAPKKGTEMISRATMSMATLASTITVGNAHAKPKESVASVAVSAPSGKQENYPVLKSPLKHRP